MTRERWWKPEARPLYRCTRQDAPLRGLGGTKYYDYTDVLDKMHHRCTGGVGWDQVLYNDTKHQTRCTEMHPLPNRFTYLGCARNTTEGSFWWFVLGDFNQTPRIWWDIEPSAQSSGKIWPPLFCKSVLGHLELWLVGTTLVYELSPPRCRPVLYLVDEKLNESGLRGLTGGIKGKCRIGNGEKKSQKFKMTASATWNQEEKMTGSPGQTQPLICINMTSSWWANICQLIFF